MLGRNSDLDPLLGSTPGVRDSAGSTSVAFSGWGKIVFKTVDYTRGVSAPSVIHFLVNELFALQATTAAIAVVRKNSA